MTQAISALTVACEKLHVILTTTTVASTATTPHEALAAAVTAVAVHVEAVAPEVIDSDLCKSITLKIAQIDRPKAVSLLEKYGAKSASTVPEAKWAAYVVEARAVLAALLKAAK